MPAVTISDLRERPDFTEDVADRIWRAWWRERGFPRDYIVERLHESLDASAIPFALVAHDNGVFAGTASVIPSDLEERPALTPWIAAVWVDPEFRKRGIGEALVEAAFAATGHLGIPRVHLCALPARAGFYARRGWVETERDVGPHRLVVFMREG